MRSIPSVFALVIVALFVAPRGFCQQPRKLSPCQLQDDPPSYNHDLVEVTGFISHGFEDFSLVDPSCPSRNEIWLEYGGKVPSNTMYCCGATPSLRGPKQLIVEKIPIPLVDDQQFRELDRLVQRTPDSIVHATIIGKFFAGEKIQYQQESWWGGYGHMGCCSLLVIQQVVSVEPQDQGDLDYRAWPDQPNIEKTGCGYRDLVPLEPYADLIQVQKKAEADGSGSALAFTNPEGVAINFIASLLKADPSSIREMRQTRKAQGRFVYEWHPSRKGVSFMIVVSRPYWLSFYSKDPSKVAWVVVGAYELSCGEKNSVVRIK